MGSEQVKEKRIRWGEETGGEKKKSPRALG